MTTMLLSASLTCPLTEPFANYKGCCGTRDHGSYNSTCQNEVEAVNVVPLCLNGNVICKSKPTFSQMWVHALVEVLAFFLVVRDPGVSLKGRISRLPEQPCWLYASTALQQHSQLPRTFCPSENWLSSRCLTSLIVRELVFPSWHQPLTKGGTCLYCWFSWLLSIYGPVLSIGFKILMKFHKHFFTALKCSLLLRVKFRLPLLSWLESK